MRTFYIHNQKSILPAGETLEKKIRDEIGIALVKARRENCVPDRRGRKKGGGIYRETQERKNRLTKEKDLVD